MTGFRAFLSRSSPMPLVYLRRVSDRLGVEVWMKRDDCTGLGLGGNKTRHLEYVLAAAAAVGADTLVFMQTGLDIGEIRPSGRAITR